MDTIDIPLHWLLFWQLFSTDTVAISSVVVLGTLDQGTLHLLLLL